MHTAGIALLVQMVLVVGTLRKHVALELLAALLLFALVRRLEHPEAEAGQEPERHHHDVQPWVLVGSAEQNQSTDHRRHDDRPTIGRPYERAIGTDGNRGRPTTEERGENPDRQPQPARQERQHGVKGMVGSAC